MPAPAQHFAALEQLYQLQKTLTAFSGEIRDPSAITQVGLAQQALANATNRLARAIASQIIVDEP